MKLNKLNKSIIALSIACAPLTAAGEEGLPNYTPLSFKLTKTCTAPALKPKEEDGAIDKDADGLVVYNEYSKESKGKVTKTMEFGVKMEVDKITNKEILEALVEEDVIQAIDGWTIALLEDEEGAVLALIKEGEEPINLSEYIWFEFGPVADSGKETRVDVCVDDEVVSRKRSGTFKIKELVYINILDMELCGVISTSEKLQQIKKGEFKGLYAWVQGTGKIESIVGGSDDSDDGEPQVYSKGGEDEDDDDEEGCIVQGSITIGKPVGDPIPEFDED